MVTTTGRNRISFDFSSAASGLLRRNYDDALRAVVERSPVSFLHSLHAVARSSASRAMNKRTDGPPSSSSSSSSSSSFSSYSGSHGKTIGIGDRGRSRERRRSKGTLSLADALSPSFEGEGFVVVPFDAESPSDKRWNGIAAGFFGAVALGGHFTHVS